VKTAGYHVRNLCVPRKYEAFSPFQGNLEEKARFPNEKRPQGGNTMKNMSKSLRVFLAFALMAVVFPLPPAQAQTYTTIHAFTNVPDGANSEARLTRDAKGNLYGTTHYGGSYNGGSVFEMSPQPNGDWTETVLYSFCSVDKCADGQWPVGGVILDAEGNLYGTTSSGGSYDIGTAFELSPATGGGWTETMLFSFGRSNGGAQPYAGLVRDAKGNLYGTTYGGGGAGNVFELSPQSGGGWTVTVLHTFTGSPDGSHPAASLILDSAGNLYGTTEYGGRPDGGGIVFEVDSSGKETVLYSFCSEAKCADGKAPAAPLIRDSAGNLYGTTENGGIKACGGYSCGVVFRLDTHNKETVLYRFCSKEKCPDGAFPVAGLIRDAAGNLYGTTSSRGLHDAGGVFKVDPATHQETVLYSFCSQNGCEDGSDSVAGLTADPEGNAYGTTSLGGTPVCGCGTVFKISP
jgi:uncharacterized repeat protein (TIGR03803 family)